MKKLTIEVEMLLPTQVTKEIEMPLYLFCKKENSYHQYVIADDGYQWAAIKEAEVKIYHDGTIRCYRHSLSESSFSKIVAMIENDYELISKDEYLQAFKLYLNQQIEWMNELINQK